MDNHHCSLSDGKDVFASFTECLNEKLDEIEAAKQAGPVVEKFDKELHWHKLDLCFQAVSKECTKLAVVYSKPPIPSEQEKKSLLECLLRSLDVLRAWYLSFPVSQGRTLKLMLKRNVSSMIESVQNLVFSVKTEGCSESQIRLQTTGKVWKNCESFKSLPKDNRDACLSKICESYRLLTDALDEIEQEISEMADVPNEDDIDDEGETWTEKDKTFLHPCLGLIKAGKGTLKMLRNKIKANGQTIASVFTKELDQAVQMTDKFSPCVDDLVLSLYPPVDHVALLENAESLANEIKSCLAVSRNCHYVNESDFPSLDFVNNAVDHNMKNLLAATASNGCL